MFKDISQFNNTEDYLPIITAILIVDFIIITLTFTNIISSAFLKKWYQTFLLSAVLADILIILIGFIITRAIYPYLFDEFTILQFLIVMLMIVLIHDILFYIMIITIPKGVNKMIDMFKDYADEVSYFAILGDSTMIITSVLIAGYLANFEANTNIIIFVVFAYLLQYIIYNT